MTKTVIVSSSLVIILPLIFFLLIILNKYFSAIYKQKKIMHYARKIYVYSLNYIDNNTNDLTHDYNLLIARNSLYISILLDKKIYKTYLENLKKLVDPRDPNLKESFEYLENVK